MNKEKLSMYKPNKKELVLIERQLDRLYERLERVPVIQGKVSGSSKDYPYIETHMTIQMAEPNVATAIKERIREKENRKEYLEAEMLEVEAYIAGLPEGIEKRVFEMVYLEDMSQVDAAEMAGYTQSMISRIIKGNIKDS